MKKLSLITLTAISLLGASLNASAAHADHVVCDHWGHHCRVYPGDDDGGLLALLASLYTTSTVNSSNDDRAVYIQNVQDDAAAYLVNGDKSALLQEAIDNLRADKGVAGSDSDIAAALISQ